MGFEYSTQAMTKWKLDVFMDVIDDFENTLADSVHHEPYGYQSYQMVLLKIAEKTLVTVRELLTLCAHGYADGALSLGRNLYEQMMIVCFFEIHKNDADFQEYIDDFFLSYEVQRNKCLRAIDAYIPDGNITQYEKEYEELKAQTKKTIRGDYWWANMSSFKGLIDYVMQHIEDKEYCEFLGKHYSTYKRACLSLHAGCMGNAIRIGSNTGFNVIDTSPSLYGQSTPLVFAVTSLLMIVGTLCTKFNIDHESFIKRLTTLMIEYQQREENDIKPDE